MKHIFSALLLLVITLINAQVTTTIPLPKDVTHGTLENGMTYYIMHNEEPKDRVSFYFAQNVGATLEEDNEDGLTHFLEHMAFNGSNNFKGRAMDSYLEKQGLVFGRDFNAYTSYDETLYNIDNVPTSNKEAIDKCLLILHDWSGSLLLEDKDIDDERGVIAEEWRQGRNVQVRTFEKIQPVLYKGSQYAKRDVIGQLDFIRSFPYKSLRDYYKKWYRPDLQAIIVVGDIDVVKMEEKIKATFGSIVLSKNAKERPYFEVPDFKETSYVLATDVGMPAVNIQWAFKQDVPAVRDETSMRATLLQTIFSGVMNSRLDEKTQNPSAAATYLGLFDESLSLTKVARSLYFEAKEGKSRAAFKELYEEIVRVQNYGLTPSEFEREKTNILNQYETAITQEKSQENATWATQLSMHYLQSQPVFKAKSNFDLVKKQLASISIEEINAVAQQYKNIDNSLFVVSGPEDNTIKYPTKEELLAIVAEVNGSKIENYEDDTNDSPLISEPLELQPIAKKFKIKGIKKAEGITLDNGINILLYPSKEKEDDISMQAISFGGLSKIATTDLPSAEMATTLVGLSGVGDFTASQLSKKMSGKNASVGPSIGAFSEGMFGSSTVKDLETLLQLTYLYFKKPRFDQAIFEAQLPVMKEVLKNRYKESKNVFEDSLQLATTNRNLRNLPQTAARVDNIAFAKAVNIYKERFADAADFTFVFTGNFETEKLLPLLQKYLGNLKTGSIKEQWTDHNIKPKDGKTSLIFSETMETPQTTVFYQLVGKSDFTDENKVIFNIVSATLDRRYVDTIREEEGGSYGVSVYGDIARIPSEKATLNIQFNCNPDKVKRLLKIVDEEINAIATKGPSTLNLEKAKENLLKDRVEEIERDEFWATQIIGNQLFSDRYLSLKDYKKMVAKITVEDVQKFTKQFLNTADTVEVIMHPKK